MLTWGDSVVAHKRVPFDARTDPRDHFALPDELAPHALAVRATVAERGARPSRFRLDRAFVAAVIAALLTHVTIGWLGAVSPDDAGESLTAEGLAAARAASVEGSAIDEATQSTPQSAGRAAPLASGVATATRSTPTNDEDTEYVRDVEEFGMLGLLDSISSDPTVGFGAGPRADSSLSGDGIWNDERGGSGLDLSGTGEGGGGPGSAVPLTEVSGLSSLSGVGHGVQLRGHVASIVCHLHFEEVILGHLDATAIQRVVHQNDGRFRGCYQAGLLKNPSLAGRVTVKFAIARDGSVVVAEEDTAESELPDADVRSCVVRAFASLSFPEPGDVVRVTYPFVFSPAD